MQYEREVILKLAPYPSSHVTRYLVDDLKELGTATSRRLEHGPKRCPAIRSVFQCSTKRRDAVRSDEHDRTASPGTRESRAVGTSTLGRVDDQIEFWATALVVAATARVACQHERAKRLQSLQRIVFTEKRPKLLNALGLSPHVADALPQSQLLESRPCPQDLL
jgi:hypothetical protein